MGFLWGWVSDHPGVRCTTHDPGVAQDLLKESLQEWDSALLLVAHSPHPGSHWQSVVG